MAAGRSAALKVDWAGITSSLGLKGSTAASLQAFKKRNDDAKRKVATLSTQSQDVDFARYRSTLNNTAIVDEIEQKFKSFKPAKYDLGRQLKAIEAFETQGMKSAEEAKAKVDSEVRTLEKIADDVKNARPFEEITVDEASAALPHVRPRVEKMVENGIWMPKGYVEKFGNLSVL